MRFCRSLSRVAALLVLLTLQAQSTEFLNPNPPGLPFESDTPPAQRPRTQVRTPLKTTSEAAAATLPVVRLGYIIPADRSAQANGVANFRSAIVDCRNWFRDQMDQYGFGPKTFRFETEADGTTPRVHVVSVPVTSEHLRGDIWGRTISAAESAGLSIWAEGEVWVLIPEAHVMAADGDISGGTALGASFGSGDDGGVAMLGSDGLAMFDPAYQKNDQSYAGARVPALGPYSLVQNVSFNSFEGSTFSSVSSSLRGALAHEMTHAFGLPHDFRNDENFHGNLMGNGLRGFRGAFLPGRYPNDYTRLSYVSAAVLNTSRYFNSLASNDIKPTLSVSTSGAVTPLAGQITIRFTAFDATGLSLAWLTRSGELISEMPLTGTSVNGEFQTPYISPGEARTYGVAVFDLEGNRRNADVSITATTGSNRGPRPAIKIIPPVPMLGQTVTLDSSQTTDPDHSTGTLQVEWDFNGDGVFDTKPTTLKTASLPMTTPGNRLIQARLSDPASSRSVSTRLQIHTHQPDIRFSLAPTEQANLSWLTKIGFNYALQKAAKLTGPWTFSGGGAIKGNGGIHSVSDSIAGDEAPRSGFYRLRFVPNNN